MTSDFHERVEYVAGRKTHVHSCMDTEQFTSRGTPYLWILYTIRWETERHGYHEMGSTRDDQQGQNSASSYVNGVPIRPIQCYAVSLTAVR